MENIHVEKIIMIKIPTEAILFDLYYEVKKPADGVIPEIPPVTEETPLFKDIFIHDVVCHGAAKALLLRGLPEMPLRNIHFENVNIIADQGLTKVDAEEIYFKDVAVLNHSGEVLFQA